MPAFDPIDIPSFVAEKYQTEINAIKKYLNNAFPDGEVDFAYSVGLHSIGFRVSDYQGNNIVFFNSMFLEDLDSPLAAWLDSSGIKEFVAMNKDATLMVSRTGELQLKSNW
jgi:hypothetical protein